jgi:hypothetical protein
LWAISHHPDQVLPLLLNMLDSDTAHQIRTATGLAPPVLGGADSTSQV